MKDRCTSSDARHHSTEKKHTGFADLMEFNQASVHFSQELSDNHHHMVFVLAREKVVSRSIPGIH